MAFKGMTITNAGKKLLSQAQTSKSFYIKCVRIGDGNYVGDLHDITSLCHALYDAKCNISQSNQNLIVEADISSNDHSGYYFREVAIIAIDSNNNEVIYAYDNAGDDAEYINVITSGIAFEKRLRFLLTMSDDIDVSIEIPGHLYALNDDLNKINTRVSNLETEIPSIYATKEYVDNKTDIKKIMDIVYPIGSVITNSSSAFDPNIIYQGTSWKRIKGKVIVGVDEEDIYFSASNKTGGEKVHTLLISEMPKHTHGAISTITNVAAHTHIVSSTATSNGAHTHGATATVATAGAHTHTVSGTAASNGAHTHVFSGPLNQGGTTAYDANTTNAYYRTGIASSDTTTAGAHTHTVSGTAASNDVHTHNATATITTAGEHTHTISSSAAGNGAHTHSATTTIDHSGSNESHNNLQPYITKYVWERVA